MNGDCGYGFSGNYKNPKTAGACSGYYSYNDKTCDLACNIVEGHWFSMASYMGSHMYKDFIDSEQGWVLFYPDTGMGSGTTYAGKSLQDKVPTMYAMVDGSKSASEYKWVPTK